MNISDSKSSTAVLAGILQLMARRGYEVELRPNQFHLDLTLGHLQPLTPEIFTTLRENGFEHSFLDKVTYTDADGAIRSRSHFRKPCQMLRTPSHIIDPD